MITNNEELMNNLNETFLWLRNGVENVTTTTGDFLVEQTPLYIQELLTWHLVKNFGVSIVMLLIFVIVVPSGVYCFKKVSEWVSCEIDQIGFRVITGIILCITGLGTPLVFFLHLFEGIKVWIAPRVFIVEELSRMVN